MLPTRRYTHNAPTKEIYGDFPVHYLYTVGIAGEKFFYALKDQKLLANTCPTCNHTYLPPKIYCEDCFDELGDESYKELDQKGNLFSFTEVYRDFRGHKLEKPYFLGLIKIQGSNTNFLHKLVNVSEPSVGMELKPVWNDERVGSIFDLQGFEPL
ncbi:MAG: Zn-ribbon domain-containing OB-fold protein [Candidatus Kariarchaeaceae archaeon]|jgi:uncharacterized OB-fold protein